MRHQLFHVVLLLFICGVAVISAVAGRAYACGYDEIKKKNGDPVVVVRELPKNGQDSSQTNTVVKPENEKWEPLRIRVSTKDLNKEKYCEKENVERMNFLNGNTVWCPPTPSDIMTKEKENTMINEILPEAIKLHTDRLLVQWMKSPLQVPLFNNNSICSRFTVPSEHHAPGVPDADFVLYVAAGPGDYSFSTWAVTCAIDAQSKRPIVGAMNIHPSHAVFKRVNVRYAAHVLAHALGFDYENMKERKMTKEVAKKEGEAKTQTVIKSKKVLENAKKHYGCDTMGEVQLEYAGEGQPTSHWNQCNAKDELMSVHASGGGVKSIGYYTALTISAFEDLGFFKGNFNMSENMTWGHNQSCKFLNTACKKKDELYPGVGSPRAMVESCTSDRQGHYSKLTESTPDYRFLGPDMITSCDPTGSGTGMLLGLPGKDSWCLDADSIKTTYDYIMTRNAVCAAVNCEDDGVVFKVQLNTNGTWYNCKKENEPITPNQKDYPGYESGTIKCPKYSEVCTIKGNGSSRFRLQEEKKVTLVIPEIPPSITTENQVTNAPSSSGSHAGQNSQTSTVNNAQGDPSISTETGGNREEGDSTTPTPGETTNNTKTRENSVDSKIVNGKEKTPISTTPNATETINDTNIRSNTTESILNISIAGKDNSQVTKVYPPFLLLVLVILNLLVSF